MCANTAYLLFAKNPSVKITGSHIRVIRFHGRERLTGSRQNIIFDERTDLPIPYAIEQAIEWIVQQIPNRRSLGDNAKFSLTPIIPKDAWVEGVVNAAIHRSYSFTGDCVRVEIYDDRLEISNPGRFPTVSAHSFDALSVPRYVRNPRIARTCTTLGYSQELGEGIKRIYDEMALAGLVEPVYEQRNTQVKLTLRYVLRLSDVQKDRLPIQSERVLDALRNLNGRAGTSDIAEMARVSVPTARKALTALKEEGIIKWTGKSLRDPRAMWSINQ